MTRLPTPVMSNVAMTLIGADMSLCAIIAAFFYVNCRYDEDLGRRINYIPYFPS